MGKWSNLTNIVQMGWNHQPVILQLLEIQACISVEKVVVDLYGIKAQRHKSENENKKVWIGDVATVGGYHLFVCDTITGWTSTSKATSWFDPPNIHEFIWICLSWNVLKKWNFRARQNATVRRCVRCTWFLQINRGCLIIMNLENSRFGIGNSGSPARLIREIRVLLVTEVSFECFSCTWSSMAVSGAPCQFQWWSTKTTLLLFVMCKMPGSAKRLTTLTIINHRYPYFKWVIPSDHAVVRSSRLIIGFTTSAISGTRLCKYVLEIVVTHTVCIYVYNANIFKPWKLYQVV